MTARVRRIDSAGLPVQTRTSLELWGWSRCHARIGLALGAAVAGLLPTQIRHPSPWVFLLLIIAGVGLCMSVGAVLSYQSAARLLEWDEQERYVLGPSAPELPILSSEEERLEREFRKLEAEFCLECRQRKTAFQLTGCQVDDYEFLCGNPACPAHDARAFERAGRAAEAYTKLRFARCKSSGTVAERIAEVRQLYPVSSPF